VGWYAGRGQKILCSAEYDFLCVYVCGVRAGVRLSVCVLACMFVRVHVCACTTFCGRY
jgi:hypothetical protein